MEQAQSMVQAGPPAEERLPWHKPEVERLRVSLDTREGQGSQSDSFAFERG